MDDEFTHLDEHGTARMVDVGAKQATRRTATARAFVRFGAHSFEQVRAGNSAKGDVLGTARIAGIQAAKRTGELIPLCHPLGLDHVDVRFAWLDDDRTLAVEATARCTQKTGVEMEALTAATVAALTVYDMVKAIDRAVCVTDVHVFAKEGGKSGPWQNDAPPGPDLAGVDWA